jgi:hypothetical protein
MNKFTPGPWNIGMRSGHNCSIIYAYNGESRHDDDAICMVYGIHNCCDKEQLASTEGAPNATLIAAAPDLLEALENVQREHSLLLSMKNCELRRGKGSFGIAVMSDDIAKEWQSYNEELDSLIGFRLSAIAKARGEA